MVRPSTAKDEAILCTIKIDGNGVLSIQPDFSKGRRPYKVDSIVSHGRGTSHIYIPVLYFTSSTCDISSLVVVICMNDTFLLVIYYCNKTIFFAGLADPKNRRS